MGTKGTKEMVDEILASLTPVATTEFGQRTLHLLKQRIVVLVCLAKSEQSNQVRLDAVKLADTLARTEAERRWRSWLKTAEDESAKSGRAGWWSQ